MKLKKNSMDIALDFLCIVMLLGISAFLLTHWGAIPDNIPMHYDFSGNVTRHGGKAEMLFLPGLAWFFFIVMSVVQKFPQIWNTGVKITEDNRDRIYFLLNHFICMTKLLFVLLFSFLTLFTARSMALPSWFMLVFIILMFGDIAYWLVKIFKNY